MRACLAVALTTLLLPSIARGQQGSAPPPTTARLVVHAREGCPTADALRADLQRRLGRDALREDAPREFAVDFVPSDGGWDVWVVVTERPTHRRLLRVIERRAQRCDELLDTTGVALAVALEAPTLAPPEEPPRAAPAPTPTATRAPIERVTGVDLERPPPIVRPRAPTAPPEPVLAASVALQGGVAFGFLATAPQWGIEVRLGAARMRWLHGVVALRSVIGVERRDTIRVLGATIGSVGACVSTSKGAFGAAGCVGVELGALHANFPPEPGRPRGDQPWFAPFAAAYGRARLVGPLFLALEARLAINREPDDDERPTDPRRPPTVQPSEVTGGVSLLVGVDL